jgi:ketosteroid isomerase-like protein
MGNEYGWNGVKEIYAMFLNTFSKRRLQYQDEPWTNYGGFAWVTFNWIFNATLSVNHKDMQTKGRETQLWKKVNGNWKLVHVHYSAMPLTTH